MPADLTGYPTVEEEVVLKELSSLGAITVSFAWVPIITCIICIVCMFFFDLDKKYDQAVADLAEGKHRTDK